MSIELITAGTGRECMDLLSKGVINLAFINVNMPEISGMEAVGRARGLGDKTFVVLMSAKVTEPRLELARQLGVYEYLVKPFTAADVGSILKTYKQVMVRMGALIVDDSRTIRRIIRQVLESGIFKLSIEEAINGEIALQRFKTGSYDIVFLDYAMPGLNGIETLDAILAKQPKAKVIMISFRETMGSDDFAFLPKPFFSIDVSRAIHKALDLKMPSLTAHWSPQREIKHPAAVCPAEDDIDNVAEDADRDIIWV